MQGSSSRLVVSIIIPCFNGEEFVGDAIRSALAQTYPHKEVIVIDDGSTDGSLDVIRSFGNAIRWQTGSNGGGGAARNLGLALARGKFIQFLDADDFLLPECVGRKVEAWQQEPDICPCCDWTREDGAGTTTLERSTVHPDHSVVAVLTGQIQISSPLHLCEDLLRVGGFDISLPCSQERDLHLRLACEGVRFRHLTKPLFVVRRRAGSVSDDYTRVLLQHGKVFSRAAEILGQNGQLTSDRRFALARALAADGRRLFHRGRVAEARKYWSIAADLDRAGIGAAYHRSSARGLLRMVGPELTESIVMAVWRVSRLGERVLADG